jgi:hypothetical protein
MILDLKMDQEPEDDEVEDEDEEAEVKAPKRKKIPVGRKDRFGSDSAVGTPNPLSPCRQLQPKSVRFRVDPPALG